MEMEDYCTNMKRKYQSNLTIDECRKMFIDSQSVKGLSEHTVNLDDSTIQKFIKYAELTSEDNISVITEVFFKNYLMKLAETDISLASKNMLLCHLRVFLYWCMENHYIKPFKIHLMKGQEPKIKFFTDEEVELLLKEPKKDCTFRESRTYAIVCFIMSTGCRVSTLVNIKMEDLDFKNKTITYTHLKNKSSVIIPMSNTLYKVLQKYIKEWDRTDNTYLFCGPNEEKMTTGSVQHSLYWYCEQRGVRPRGPHSLRHSFARMYIKSGGDPFSLQHILTHSSMEMTKRYVNLFSDDLRDSLNSYNPLDNIKVNRSKTVHRSAIQFGLVEA